MCVNSVCVLCVVWGLGFGVCGVYFFVFFFLQVAMFVFFSRLVLGLADKIKKYFYLYSFSPVYFLYSFSPVHFLYSFFPVHFYILSFL